MNPKLLSGRFLLTVISGCVFAYVACTRILPPEATAAVLSTVFTCYFNRSDRRRIDSEAELATESKP